jgi:hypothetical protein
MSGRGGSGVLRSMFFGKNMLSFKTQDSYTTFRSGVSSVSLAVAKRASPSDKILASYYASVLESSCIGVIVWLAGHCHLQN